MGHKRNLPKEVRRAGLKRVIEEGVASHIKEALTTGVFLVGIALQLGASNLVIGILGAVPFLANLFQIPALFLIEKYRDRRRMVGIACSISRSFLLLVAVAPFFADRNIAIALVVIGMTMRYCVGALSICCWNSWMRDLVPSRLLGRFFSRRLFYVQGTALLLTLSAGFFIDWWQKHLPTQVAYSYSILYLLGFLAGMLSTTMILTIPHPPMPSPETKAYGASFRWSYLKTPFRNRNFRKLMLFLVSWNFAANLAAPFFTVYMLKTLDYDMSFVVGITLMGQIIHVISLRVWGKYSDMYSNKTVMRLCGTLFIFCILGWTFTTFPDKHRYTTLMLIVLHIFMGIANSGVMLTSSNIALKLAPKDKATTYLAVNSIMGSLAAGIAPLIGGGFADYFENKEISFDIRWQTDGVDLLLPTLSIKHWDFFFLLAFIIGLYALRRLSLVEERGAVSRQVLIRELMYDTGRTLRTVSTISGLRDLAMLPMAMMVNLVKRKQPAGQKEPVAWY